MKYIYFFILTFISQVVISQNTSIVIKSGADNFIVFLDDVQQSKTPNTYLRINNIDKITLDVKISFTDNNNSSYRTKLELNAGGEKHFSIKKTEGEYNLTWLKDIAIDAIRPIGKGQTEVNYIDPEGKEHLTPIVKEKYTGTKGCEKAITLGEVMSLYKSMTKLHYPDEKYKLISKSLKSRCVSTAQIIKLLEALSGDFYQEKFAIFAYDVTYDLDNYNDVISILNEKSTKKVTAKLGL